MLRYRRQVPGENHTVDEHSVRDPKIGEGRSTRTIETMARIYQFIPGARWTSEASSMEGEG
jgi:hypothetical protein